MPRDTGPMDPAVTTFMYAFNRIVKSLLCNSHYVRGIKPMCRGPCPAELTVQRGDRLINHKETCQVPSAAKVTPC